MKKTLSVLIVEDHQINIDSYKRALDVVEKDIMIIDFEIVEAKNCDEAFDAIKSLKHENGFDLTVLDISLPPSKKYNILNGEVLGQRIRQRFPNCKLLVCTSYNDNIRLNNILRSLNPEVFLIKSDIDFSDLINAIKKIINEGSYYSKTILNLMRNKYSSDIVLDELDIKILYEISLGANMNELMEIIPLSRAGIEKRKRLLKSNFRIKNNSNRDLILAAKERGYL